MRERSVAVGLAVAVAISAALGMPATARTADPGEDADRATLRVATYHVGLEREAPGELIADLEEGDDQAAALAQVLQTVRPDVVLLTAFDQDPEGEAVALFRAEYLEVGQHGEEPIAYPHVFTTEVPEDEDASEAEEADFPGSGGMVLLSQHPIDENAARTFDELAWGEMPGALLPPGNKEAAVEPLSSGGHWDVPVEVGSTTVHILASQPILAARAPGTAERNHDEIRLWADYVSEPRGAEYLTDDAGERGGLTPGSRFVIAGPLGADPHDGPAVDEAASQLLEHPRVRDPQPASTGAVEAAETQRGANARHEGPHEQDTADLDDEGPGNLRLDYVLPSKNLPVREAGVFWPAADEPGSELTGVEPSPTSDHRAVWADVQVPGLD